MTNGGDSARHLEEEQLRGVIPGMLESLEDAAGESGEKLDTERLSSRPLRGGPASARLEI